MVQNRGDILKNTKFIDGLEINFIIRRTWENESKKVSSMEDLVRQTYLELKSNSLGGSFKDWVLKESHSPFESHTEFTKAFIYTAFKMFDAVDWADL